MVNYFGVDLQEPCNFVHIPSFLVHAQNDFPRCYEFSGKRTSLGLAFGLMEAVDYGQGCFWREHRIANSSGKGKRLRVLCPHLVASVTKMNMNVVFLTGHNSIDFRRCLGAGKPRSAEP